MPINDDEYWEKKIAEAEAELKELNDRVVKGELLEKSEVERLLIIMDQWLEKFMLALAPKRIEFLSVDEWERFLNQEWKKRRPELDRLLGPRMNIGLRFSKEDIARCLKERFRRGGSEDGQN